MTTIDRPTSATEAPACPSWCEAPVGHDWPVSDPIILDRGHYLSGARYIGPGRVYVAGYGETLDRDFEPLIQVDTVDSLNATEARSLAAELVRLAEVLDAATHRATPPTVSDVFRVIEVEMNRQGALVSTRFDDLRSAGEEITVSELHDIAGSLGLTASELMRRSEALQV